MAAVLFCLTEIFVPELLADAIEPPGVERIAFPVWWFDFAQRQRGELELLERRPWQPDDPLHRFSLRYDLMGPEEGLSQAERRQRLEAA